MSATVSKPRSKLGQTLFAKCLVLILASSLTMAVVAAYIGSEATQNIALTALTREAKTATDGIAGNSGGALRFGKADTIVAQLEALQALENSALAGAIVIDSEGAIVGQSGVVAAKSSQMKTMAETTLGSGQTTVSEDGLLVASPVRMGEGQQVVGVITTSWSSAGIRQEIISSWRARILILLGVFAAISVVATFLLRRSITMPLQAVRDSIVSIRDGDLDNTVPFLSRSDEVGQIAASVEEFRCALKESAITDRRLAEAQEKQKVVVERLSTGLRALAAGDLRHRIDSKFPAEHDALRNDFNDTLSSLGEAVASLQHSADQMRQNSNTINASAGHLSQRSTMQAATLQETVAALTELSSSVKAAAKNAKEVDQIVTQTTSDARASVSVVKNAVSAMKEIEQSSTQIEQIISVIQDIAFQTNLLALNAGVEAARAGEAGRGFAVVASEVRALAQRSAEAAKEIRELISGSGEQVERGSSLVRETGNALGGIADQVANISTLVGKIAENVSQQSDSLSEINVGMSQLDQVTQQNAEMANNSSEMSKSLLSESLNLSQLVSAFKFDKASPDELSDVA